MMKAAGREQIISTRTVLVLAAALEAATGMTLIFSPAIVVRLLLGADLMGAGVNLGRVGGFGLLSLGIACWPGSETGGGSTRVQAVRAMLTYNALAAAYLAYLRVGAEFSSILLWPAVVLHVLLALLFALALWMEGSETSPGGNA